MRKLNISKISGTSTIGCNSTYYIACRVILVFPDTGQSIAGHAWEYEELFRHLRVGLFRNKLNSLFKS